MSVRLYRLHYEILQFYQFMIPSEEEHAVRQQVINRITNVINQYLPSASVSHCLLYNFTFLYYLLFSQGEYLWKL